MDVLINDKKKQLIIGAVVLLLCFYSAIANSYTNDNNMTTNDALINQLPTTASCPGYQNISNKPFSILACFAATLGNNRTNQTLIRDAYRQFHALNWPVDGDTIGLPNYALKSSEQADTFPVWQSWPTTHQVKYTDINNWDENDFTIPASCGYLFEKTSQGKGSKYTAFIKQYPTVPRGPKIEVLTNAVNPQNDIVVDINAQAVRYQVYMNKPAFEFSKGLSSSVTDDINYPVAKGVSEQYGITQSAVRGAIFIKAAWKVLQPEEFANYHKSFAVVTSETADGMEICELNVVGLSAMHIVNKNNPKNIGSPGSSANETNKWSWATYEFVGNAPSYTFTGDGIEELTENSIKPTLGNSWAFFKQDWTGLRKMCVNEKGLWQQNLSSCPINKNGCGKEEPCEKSTIVLHPSEQDVKNLTSYNNATMRELKNSVWKNYRIINNQWSDMGYVKPEKLENPILEAFSKKRTSCSGCHKRANKAKFNDFIFSARIKDVFTGTKINLSK